MRKFTRRQIRAYYELRSWDRAYWVLQGLFVLALVGGIIGIVVYSIVTGEISNESNVGGG